MDNTDIERLEWVIVDSSNLNAVAYDDSTLYVMFKSGPAYMYTPLAQRDVLQDYLDLLDADSQGKFLHSGIIPYYKAVKL